MLGDADLCRLGQTKDRTNLVHTDPRCKLEYILYSCSFPPTVAWIMFLDIFTAFNIPLPLLLLLSVMQFVLACSPAGFIDLSNEQSRSVLAARHPAEKQAGSGFRLSNKPLTFVTLKKVEIKVMQLCENLSVTSDKMRNNGGTR
ncbi:hypothetical protein NQZ68_009236 [Dissostichus eleginoides]|nr:hypothetical protein NQZ68_009236 [Dissostichus eleginoides]